MKLAAIQLTVDSDLNDARPQFTLTCISTGGPATTVTWTRDTTTVTQGYMTVLVDTRTAQYIHTLTVTGRMPGLYNCIVKNNKPSTTSRTFTVKVASVPTNLASVVAGNDSTNIHLTWTPPTPLADTTGYMISSTGGGNSSSVDVSGGTTDNYTLTGLTRGEMYNISIVGISEHFFSESVAWDTVKLPEREVMNEKEQEKGGKSNSGNAGSIAAGVLVPLILVAVIATLVVVTLIWLKRRCIQGLFGSPSATTSTTSKTVNFESSASTSTPIYDEVDTLRGVKSSQDIQLMSNEAYAPVINTSANSAYGQLATHVITQ
ncbi:hypothetical protein GBAR_LOCUS20225 [Geodia barretti]|nr:hypothetical protein GBAR_LOCUS20225 [Geodia barretti]